MKRIFISLMGTIFIPSMLMAAQVTKQITVEWGYPAEQESSISGFRLYNQDGVVVFDKDKAAPGMRTLTVPYTYDDARPQAFHMVSVGADDQLSTPSNIFVIKQPFKPLIGVGTITIKIQE